MLFASLRVVLKTNFSMFTEIIIDDFQIDKQNRNIFPDATGFKLGLEGYKLLDNNNYLNYQIEYTEIGTWTYTHENYMNNWFNFSQPLGHLNGPDCKSFIAKINYVKNKNIILTIENEYIEKGSVGIFTPANQQNTADWTFPSANVVYNNLLKPQISYLINESSFLLKTNFYLIFSNKSSHQIGFSVQFSKHINST